MKIQIENLKAQMQGIELNIYQKADALIEFNKLLDYVEELEKLTIPEERSEQYDCVLYNIERQSRPCDKQCDGCKEGIDGGKEGIDDY